jgi:RNA polymerase sigma-70 factor, ECF subfamily
MSSILDSGKMRLSRGLSASEVSEAHTKYGSLVVLRCRRILRDEGAAEDAAQETFLRLWRYGSAFREAESKVAWLYRVAERCCFDQVAQRDRRAEVPLTEATDWPEPRVSSRSIEDWNCISRFLGRFDERLQRIAVMYYVDDMTQEEIARGTGWSRPTVIKKLDFLRTRAMKLKTSLTGEE